MTRRWPRRRRSATMEGHQFARTGRTLAGSRHGRATARHRLAAGLRAPGDRAPPRRGAGPGAVLRAVLEHPDGRAAGARPARRGGRVDAEPGAARGPRLAAARRLHGRAGLRLRELRRLRLRLPQERIAPRHDPPGRAGLLPGQLPHHRQPRGLRELPVARPGPGRLRAVRAHRRVPARRDEGDHRRPGRRARERHVAAGLRGDQLPAVRGRAAGARPLRRRGLAHRGLPGAGRVVRRRRRHHARRRSGVQDPDDALARRPAGLRVPVARADRRGGAPPRQVRHPARLRERGRGDGRHHRLRLGRPALVRGRHRAGVGGEGAVRRPHRAAGRVRHGQDLEDEPRPGARAHTPADRAVRPRRSARATPWPTTCPSRTSWPCSRKASAAAPTEPPRTACGGTAA